ncbi:MAG: hypothetical protein LBG90_04655 [Spirochaetaceae bacterium]|nr:hypothetical protein [Spirochaetaceae bacterium]
MSYTFEKDNLAELNGTSKIINIGDRFSLEEATKIQRQLLTLFGEPGFISQDLEAAYGYGIIAKDSSGKTAVLHVYEGPSGPAIGGNRHQPGITEIAKALQDYIKQAEPADFEYEG